MRQIGSSGDDRVARGGGVIADANGNAVVFGDTNGSLFRDRDEEEYKEGFSDVFAMVFRKEDGLSQNPVTPAHHTTNNDHSAPTEWYSALSNNNLNGAKTFGIFISVFAILGMALYCWRRRQTRKEGECPMKIVVFAFLRQQFLLLTNHFLCD
jgi:hypothetical protein